MMTKKYFDALDNLLDKPIAFNPSFKKVTGSTNAALLLSQAFYWSKRTSNSDGWFYKTRDEWMEETGLTESELDGAREKCRSTGVLEEKLKGVPATLHYRVIKERVYELLGFQFPENPESQFPEIPESSFPGNSQFPENPESGTSRDFNKETENTSRNTTQEIIDEANRKVDAYLTLMKAPGLKKEARIDAILSYIAVKLNINTETKRWKEFAEFVENRQKHHGEQIDRFMTWLTGQEKFDIQFWSPARMREFWPQAFASQSDELTRLL